MNMEQPHDQRSRDDSLGVERQPGSLRGSPEEQEKARIFAIKAARSLADDKCEEILVLDLRGLSQVTDFFVIASGTSERQMRSAGQHIAELGKDEEFGVARDNLREKESTWVVVDFVDVVVHLFEPETRLFYDLEMLWGDAEPVEWQRGDEDMARSAGRNRAGLTEEDVLEGDEEE